MGSLLDFWSELGRLVRDGVKILSDKEFYIESLFYFQSS